MTIFDPAIFDPAIFDVTAGLQAASGIAIGTSTASAIGITISAAAGSSVGTSIASAVGNTISRASGQSIGTSTASAIGRMSKFRANMFINKVNKGTNRALRPPSIISRTTMASVPSIKRKP